VLDRWMRERTHGLPRGFLDRLIERAADCTLAEVNAFIRRYYDPSQFTLVRVAPE
jgi:predicted Zn-dependent peptidase